MIRTWLSRWARPRCAPIRTRGTAAPTQRRSPLRMERLEDRTVPALLPLTDIGVSGFLNGAEYISVDPQPTGTGYIDPFVRIQRSPSNPSGMEHGYNTDGIEEFDTKDAGGHNWNHSLKLSSLQAVNGYYHFTLDVNETKPGALISLDELQVFVQSDPNLTGANLANAGGTITSWQKPKQNGNGFTTVGANLVYDLDGGHIVPGPSPDGDSSVLLDYFLNHGSGSGDMTVRIPVSLFPAVRGQQYVYLYSKFGQDVAGAGSESGFEEWTALLGQGPPQTFSLSGRKLNDLNGDGNIIGDPGISGWEINLYRESNGSIGLQTGAGGDAYVTSQSTGGDGSFSFTNLTSGATYYTTETSQPGWTQTYGGNDLNNYYTTLLNGDVPDIFFGNFQLVGINGKKVTDRTGNGVTADDTGLGGVTVNLFRDGNGNGELDAGDGNPVQTTATAGDGTFSFAGVGPGTYFVQEVVPAGYTQTGGPAFYTVIVGGSGVQSGGSSGGNDFANFELFEISGVKYRDIDRDGVKDAGEPLLSGWTIFIDTDNDGVLDQGETSTVTGPGGAYSFTNLGPGPYIIREVQKPNWDQTSANPSTITGISGVDLSGVDFGNALTNPGIGRTKGYWHNQNGAATIAAMGGWDVIKHELENLYLRNEDGTLFHAANRTLAEFQDFITFESNASNAVSQLSAQLAAAYLNMRAGGAFLTTPEGDAFATGDTLLSVPTSVSPTGYITVSELVAEGRRILHGNNLIGPPLADYDLIDPSPERAYALAVMTSLDNFNQNLNIVNA